MMHQIYSRYLKQSVYIDNLGAGLVEEETRLDHMESFLTSAEKSFNTEYGLFSVHVQCLTGIVELQFGDKSTFRVLTSKPTLTKIKSSVLDDMFNEKSEKRKSQFPMSTIEHDTFCTKVSRTYSCQSSITLDNGTLNHQLWPALALRNEYESGQKPENKVYTRSWLKLLPYLQADEQWQLHWKDIVLDGDDSVFTE